MMTMIPLKAKKMNKLNDFIFYYVYKKMSTGKKILDNKKTIFNFILGIPNEIMGKLDEAKTIRDFADVEDNFLRTLTKYYHGHPSFVQAVNIVNNMVSIYRYDFIIKTLPNYEKSVVDIISKYNADVKLLDQEEIIEMNDKNTKSDVKMKNKEARDVKRIKMRNVYFANLRHQTKGYANVLNVSDIEKFGFTREEAQMILYDEKM